MLTYRATNTQTGRYYIGSSQSYCHYMNRIGNHHIRKDKRQFIQDLQANPRLFIWEILREDELTTRDYEYELLQKHVGDPLCYNISKTNGGLGPGVAPRGAGWEHSSVTKLKMSESALRPEAQPAHKKEAQSRAVSETNAKKQPCPECGILFNVGNLTKHVRGTRCKGRQQVG
jgi:hypothetical protein